MLKKMLPMNSGIRMIALELSDVSVWQYFSHNKWHNCECDMAARLLVGGWKIRLV